VRRRAMSNLNDLDLVAVASLSDPTCKSTNLAGYTPEVLRAAREARARAVREMAWALRGGGATYRCGCVSRLGGHSGRAAAARRVHQTVVSCASQSSLVAGGER